MSQDFLDFKLSKVVILQPFDLQGHIVPHLKDLTHIYLEPEAQGHGMSFKGIFGRLNYP